MQLYLKSDLPFEDLAKHMAEKVLPAYKVELRDGLNLGGGEYYKFSSVESTILLVCNDTDHYEVFVESMQDFPYYFYVRAGFKDVLEKMRDTLTAQGFECEIAYEL
ncbi:MAG TPA: hypothetical protein VIF82_01485 [Burkholderiaceae bacterium]|jgi:hypothetical protein